VTVSTTDSIEYGWFVWPPGRGREAGQIFVLADTPETERRVVPRTEGED
jgi:hypothetical protein